MEETIKEIAYIYMGLEDINSIYSVEVTVSSIKEALDLAYTSGRFMGLSEGLTDE